MFIDSHAHLATLSVNEYNETLDRALAAGVSIIVNVATDLNASELILKQTHQHSSITVLPTVGICTPDTEFASKNWEDEVNNILDSNDSISAIGEIGIDGINESYPSLDYQLPFFRKQLEIARDNNLPALIHSRGVEKEALAICDELQVPKALFHCFTGDLEAANEIVKAGHIISFSGIITFKNSNFDNILKSIPNDQILFETDSPYLAPVPYRGKCNEPAYVADVYRYAANVRNISVEELAQHCQKTFNKLFTLS